ncbi:translation initiation factor IF-2-like [Chiroxiphia lanceolata]|uniref:translation initiation factor IF-2-like n=1 Tax=Chiroxiphia lanceolata TaxID=296741 RepID=UPI0013CE81F2|nr:translation initiation factor IF-2-like [Chiroxiphia lanceolata]
MGFQSNSYRPHSPDQLPAPLTPRSPPIAAGGPRSARSAGDTTPAAGLRLNCCGSHPPGPEREGAPGREGSVRGAGAVRGARAVRSPCPALPAPLPPDCSDIAPALPAAAAPARGPSPAAPRCEGAAAPRAAGCARPGRPGGAARGREGAAGGDGAAAAGPGEGSGVSGAGGRPEPRRTPGERGGLRAAGRGAGRGSGARGAPRRRRRSRSYLRLPALRLGALRAGCAAERPLAAAAAAAASFHKSRGARPAPAFQAIPAPRQLPRPARPRRSAPCPAPRPPIRAGGAARLRCQTPLRAAARPTG